MYPILFELGPITIHTVGVFHALGFAAGAWWFFRRAKQLGFNTERLNTFVLVIILWAVIGARILSVLFDGKLNWYLQNPHHIFMIWEGGFTFYGGFLFALIGGIVYVRRYQLSAWNIGDMIAPGLALGGAVGRLGCFFSGDSFGKPVDLPWAVVFSDPHSLAPTGIPLHPTQIYSVFTNFVVFGLLLWWQKRQKFTGELFLVYLILYAATRSFVEIFRNDPRGVYLDGLISTSQIIAILIAGGAGIFYAVRYRKLHANNL